MAEFEDGKADSALRTIGEVSEALDIKPHVLRYWEQQFSPLKPLKRSGGRRYYRPEDIALVEEIDRLVNEEGYTLKGAEAVLRSSGLSNLERRQGERRGVELRSGDRRVGENAAPISAVPSAEARDLAKMVTQLKAIRKRLAGAIEV